MNRFSELTFWEELNKVNWFLELLIIFCFFFLVVICSSRISFQCIFFYSFQYDRSCCSFFQWILMPCNENFFSIRLIKYRETELKFAQKFLSTFEKKVKKINGHLCIETACRTMNWFSMCEYSTLVVLQILQF